MPMQATHAVMERKAAARVQKQREEEVVEEVVVDCWHPCIQEAALLRTLMPCHPP